MLRAPLLFDQGADELIDRRSGIDKRPPPTGIAEDVGDDPRA
jgi:hypothetical protein